MEEYLFLLMMLCVKPIIAEHFEMFFRDMYNKTLDKIKGRDAFGYKFIILVPGIMKGH